VTFYEFIKLIVSILVTVQVVTKAQRIENWQLAIGFDLNIFNDIPRIRRLSVPYKIFMKKTQEGFWMAWNGYLKYLL